MPGENGSTLPPAWEQMLAQIEQALAAAVASADQREQARFAVPPAGPTTNLARFQECLLALTACAEQGEPTVAEIDRALAEGEDALRAWFQQAEVVRRKLADRAGRV